MIRTKSRTVFVAFISSAIFTFVASAFAQLPGAPQGITQATVLNFKNVKTACQGAVDFSLREAQEPDTATHLAKLETLLRYWTAYKNDYKATATVKSNIKQIQELRIEQAYQTILEMDRSILILKDQVHLGPVFESFNRCLQEVERLKKFNIPYVQSELDQIYQPYYELLKNFNLVQLVLNEYEDLSGEFLKLDKVPVNATPAQVEEAELRASLKATQALLASN